VALTVEVLDLGINNLASLCRGLGEAGVVGLRTISNAEESVGADLLVLPGVGAYGAAVNELEARGLDRTVKEHVAAGGLLFGVCLGMQLLGSSSDESPGYAGLGLVPGTVHKLIATEGSRVPNMGWSGVSPTALADPFPTLSKSLDFYFVHSFALVPDDPSDILLTSEFGSRSFVSGILRGNVLGMQFHPEKSSRAGNQLLVDVVEWARG
jgi:imidazole glycerol-phosphate synthase subunit HisH